MSDKSTISSETASPTASSASISSNTSDDSGTIHLSSADVKCVPVSNNTEHYMPYSETGMVEAQYLSGVSVVHNVFPSYEPFGKFRLVFF